MDNRIWKKVHQKRRNSVKRSFKSVFLCLLCVAMLASGMTIAPPAYAQEAPCTQAAHTHGEDCYIQVTEETLEWLACAEDADEIVHKHDSFCYDETGVFRCPLEEKEAHTHDESCWQEAHSHGGECYREVRGELTCQEPGDHVHEAACYEQKEELTCGLEGAPAVEAQLICAEEHEHTDACWSAAQEGHDHTDDCYTTVQGELICTEHVHTDGCYATQQEQICEQEELDEPKLICEKEELELHTHEEDCYDEEGTLICKRAQVVEHVHSEACIMTETVPVDTEGLTCAITDETHEHGVLCYGTWVLDCDQPEHTHSEACGSAMASTQTPETPTETTEATTTETTEDIEGEETEEQEAADYGLEKAEGNESEYRDKLDGDNAFIDSLEVVDIVTGSAPFDPNDEPGNDSGPGNLVLRTFDTAIYKVRFSTALYNAVMNQDIVGYKEGRVHFEFILPVAPEEAEFNLSSMGTLLELPGVVIKLDTQAQRMITRNGEKQSQTIQVLRGSFLMPATDKAAIGSSELTLDVAVQVWRMSNGETLRPEFTLWLEYNNVGAEYTDESKTIHSNLVTGLNHACETIDEESAEDKPEGADDELHRMHGVEAKTVAADPITVSAEPRFNVSVYSDAESKTSGLGVYDFSTGGERAAHKTDLSHTQENEKLDHSIYGRIYCYGLLVEMIADPENPSKGMLGAAFPDENQPITFEVVVRSGYKSDSSSGGYAMLENQYQGLLWSAGANEFDIVDDSFERNAYPEFTSCYYTPLNEFHGNVRGNCYNGGDWYVELDSYTNAQGLVFDVAKITITGFEVNFDQMPYSCVSEERYLFWQPTDAVPDYLEMKRAIFASGELWAMVPYTSRVDASSTLTDDYPSGSTRLQAILRNVVIYHEGAKPGDVLGSNVNTSDDSVTYDSPYEKKGDMDTLIRYSSTSDFWVPLTTNCISTLLDWALGSSGEGLPGQELAIAVHTNLHNAEGLNRAVGFDTLLKFDDTFFVPSGVATNGSWFDPGTDKILWAAKPDGTGWDHGGLNPDQPGYDLQMMQATPEQLVYFESLEELQQSHVCVGVLIQKRGIFGVGNNQLITRVNGTVNPEAKSGYVYMTAFASRVWRLYDVADAVREKNHMTAGAIPSDEQFVEYAQTYLPRWENQKTSTGISYGNYPTASYVESYQYTSSAAIDGNDGSVNGHNTSYKAVYDSAGRYVDGSGAYYYIDSCLLLDYATSIGKSTAQIAENPETSTMEAKRHYEQGLDQRYVDYVLTPQARRVVGGTGSTDSIIKTNVYIVDEIPEGMTLIPGSVYWEGQTGTIIYESYPDFKGQGMITNGLQPVAAQGNPQPENKDGNGAWMELDTTTEGTLRITLHNVTVSGNSITDFGRIYYSCYIDGSVKGNTQLSNTASIQSDEDMREPKPENGNMATFGITVLRMTALSFTKSSDKLVAEWWEDLGFAMHLGNSSGTVLNDVILMDTLPVNTKDGTVFHGNLVVSDVSVQLQAGENAVDPTAGIDYYYTTDLGYAGCRASDLEIEDITNNGRWIQLNGDSTTFEDGKVVFTQLAGINADGSQFYEGTNIPVQVIAIIAVGDIPAGHTLSMHVTLRLPHGQAGDVLYNYLSRSGNHTTYAKTTLINRKISGLVWYDVNQDGIRQNSEDLWSGIWVTLLRKNEDDVYEPVYYQDTLGLDPANWVPVVIKTGERASVQKQGSVEAYKDENGNDKTGAYLFTDLPAGTYAVCFNTGETYVLEQYQLTIKDKGDKTVNSNAEVYSNNGEFVGYLVPDIKLSATSLMNVSYEVSAYHDAGFCNPYLLPNTGGMGAVSYCILGAILTLPALAGLRRRRKR